MTVRAIINGQMATSGSIIFLTGQEKVAQNLETRLLEFYGEFFLNNKRGTPWFQSILGKFDPSFREDALKKIILETDDVVKLTEFTLNQESRALDLKASVITIFSADPLQISVNPPI